MYGDKVNITNKICMCVAILSIIIIFTLAPHSYNNNTNYYISNSKIYDKLISMDLKIDETNKLIKELQQYDKR